MFPLKLPIGFRDVTIFLEYSTRSNVFSSDRDRKGHLLKCDSIIMLKINNAAAPLKIVFNN